MAFKIINLLQFGYVLYIYSLNKVKEFSTFWTDNGGVFVIRLVMSEFQETKEGEDSDGFLSRRILKDGFWFLDGLVGRRRWRA